jgi:5-methylcytosine-specific restriction endonuclease McrA
MSNSPYPIQKISSNDCVSTPSSCSTIHPPDTKRIHVDFSKLAFQPDSHLFNGEKTGEVETKHTILDLGKKERVIREKQPTPRVITRTEQWATYSVFLDPSSQKQILNCISDKLKRENGNNLGDFTESLRLCADYVYRQIHDKQGGYRYQDVVKNIYDATACISTPLIVDLLCQCDLTCFYCRDPVKILYEHVRDKKQWSLERLDNSRGHNTDNVVIACLSCNLKRRTMYYERFVATKQMRFVKVDGVSKGE